MSLYDQISNSLSTQGIRSGIGGAIDSALGDIGGDTAFGKALGNIGAGIARNAAVGLVNKYIPGHLQRMAQNATGALGDVLNGDLGSAGLRMLDSGLLDKIIPGITGVGSQARFFGTPTPLFGGLSPAAAREIYQEMHQTPYCRKNLWLIEVGSAAAGDASSRFNLFATDLEYSPFTISGEKKQIGAAHADIVTSSDPVELRMTTYDDQSGFIKAWFKHHCAATAGGDGTVGVPSMYAIKIKIVHGFVKNESRGYEDVGLFRPANIDMSLSRREDGLEELQLSFVQLDTFIEPSTISG